MIARTDHCILQSDAYAIAALLAEILSPDNARATTSATMRVHRMIRSRASQRLTAAAAKAQMIVIVQIALLAKHCVSLKRFGDWINVIPTRKKASERRHHRAVTI